MVSMDCHKYNGFNGCHSEMVSQWFQWFTIKTMVSMDCIKTMDLMVCHKDNGFNGLP